MSKSGLACVYVFIVFVCLGLLNWFELFIFLRRLMLFVITLAK